MMKYYRTYGELHNGTAISYGRNGVCLTEEERIPKIELTITWDNLEEIYKRYGELLPFSYRITKKGRIIQFYDEAVFNKDTWVIKEWKKELNMTAYIHNKEVEATFQDLKHFEAKKVQKYLAERA